MSRSSPFPSAQPPFTHSQLPAPSYLELQDRGQGKEKKKREKGAKKVGKERRKLQKALQGVCEGVLVVSCLGIVSPTWPPLLLRLPDGYEQLCGLLSDNCSLLIYNVKLNDSLSPASSPLLEADSALMQAATPAPIG